METLAAQPEIDRNKQVYDDLTTQFAEMVNGSMRNHFTFDFDGQDFYARDGRALQEIFEDSLEEADDAAEDAPELSFEVRRRRHEINEHHDMKLMAWGKLPNAMAVQSDFADELMEAPKDVGGYNVKRKQTMFRLLYWDGSRMHMYSQSLDLSDRPALEAMRAKLGFGTRPGELLSQRMHFDLDPETEPSELVDQQRDVYDTELAATRGGQWHAGRPVTSTINTYDFVRKQRDIMQLALQEYRQGRLDVFAIAATLQARFEENTKQQPMMIIERHTDPLANIHQEIQREATRASFLGMIFSACGLTVQRETEGDGADQLDQAGYGSKSKKELSWHGGKIKKGTCVNCKEQTKVGVAGWCKTCIKC